MDDKAIGRKGQLVVTEDEISPYPPTPVHASDCAVHNEPAYPNGPCDCGAIGVGYEPIDNSGIKIGAVAELQILVDDNWVTVPNNLKLKKGIVFRILEDGVPKKALDGVEAFEVLDPEVGGRAKITPYVKRKPTCEGCRHLEYNGIPRWKCKKYRLASPMGQTEGYPTRGCPDGGGYRK